MFRINTLTVPSQAVLWGGFGDDVRYRPFQESLGGEGSKFVLDIPSFGALFLEDMGPHPEQWTVRVNGQNYTYRGGGELAVAIERQDDPKTGTWKAVITGGEGNLEVPLITFMGYTDA